MIVILVDAYCIGKQKSESVTSQAIVLVLEKLVTSFWLNVCFIGTMSSQKIPVHTYRL